MLRNPIKPVLVLGLLVVALLLAPWAAAQTGQGAAVVAPAGDIRARMWAATARFVYADDPALQKIQLQLQKTVDSSSVKSFDKSLQQAVFLAERVAPDKKLLKKFQGIFNDLSTGKKQKAVPADLAKAIGEALLENKTSADKAARLVNPAFISLQKTLQWLANPASAAMAPTAAGLTTAPPAPAGPVAPSLITSDGPPAAPTREAVPAISPWTWAALGLSVLSLLVALFKIKPVPTAPTVDAAAINNQLTELRDKVKKLEWTMNNRSVVAPAPAAAETEAPPVAVAAPVAPAAPIETVMAPAPSQLHVLYANQQPIDGLFPRNSLAGAPASYTIFELTMDDRSPDQARFVVTRNPGGHAGFIGSHHTILGGACIYPFPQGNVTRIVTEVPGLAERTAGGDWQVKQKAHIRFE